MRIKKFQTGDLLTNSYLLFDLNLKEAAIIDAPENVFKHIKTYLEKFNFSVKKILITHGHWDHTFEMELFRSKGAVSYAHIGDKDMIENPNIMLLFLNKSINLIPSLIDVNLNDNDIISILNEKVKILHVPGHSPGNIAFYFKRLNIVFTGDSLFKNSIGRHDLPGGNKKQLLHSIKSKLYALPNETIVFPGHGAETTIGNEKMFNQNI